MLEIPWNTFSIVLLIFVVAAITQGVTGFGFGVVAMTLLPFVLNLKDAINLLAILNAVIMVCSVYWQKRAFKWKESRYLLIGSVLGVPIGASMLHVLPENLLTIILGATMLYTGVSFFFTRHQIERPRIKKAEIPLGMFCGLLAAAFNMGGPPVVAYAYSRDWTADLAKTVLASVFMITALSRLCFIGFTGENTILILWLSVFLTIPTAIVLRFGIGLGRRVPHEFLRPIVFAYLAIIGVYYLVGHV